MTIEKNTWTANRIVDVLWAPGVDLTSRGSMVETLIRAGADVVCARAAVGIYVDNQRRFFRGDTDQEPGCGLAVVAALSGERCGGCGKAVAPGEYCPCDGEAKPEPPRPLGVVLSESSGHRLIYQILGRRGPSYTTRLALARPGRDALCLRVVVASSGRGWWSATPDRAIVSGVGVEGRVEALTLDECLPGDGRVRFDRYEVYDLSEVEAYAAATNPNVPEWARTAEKKSGGAERREHLLKGAQAYVEGIERGAGAVHRLASDIIARAVAEALSPGDARPMCTPGCGARPPDGWLLCWDCQPHLRTRVPDAEAIAAFVPPPWPAPETDDPYKAPRIRAIDEASNGHGQRLPPSRTLAEALARARERRAIALGGLRHLTAFVADIDAATATAEAPPHVVLCCALCGGAENDALAERGAVCTLTEMVRLPDGRLACEACARKEGVR